MYLSHVSFLPLLSHVSFSCICPSLVGLRLFLSCLCSYLGGIQCTFLVPLSNHLPISVCLHLFVPSAASLRQPFHSPVYPASPTPYSSCLSGSLYFVTNGITVFFLSSLSPFPCPVPCLSAFLCVCCFLPSCVPASLSFASAYSKR